MTFATLPASAGRTLEIMDTTLRDGEQTQGVALLPEEKLALARLLLVRVGVDRLEIASARVSPGERRAVELVTAWAQEHGCLERIEVLGFCDHQRSADWIGEAGGRVINLLTKGSFAHLTAQLRKTPEAHLADIAATVAYCRQLGIAVNCYPEDWSGGMLESNDYARWFIAQLVQLPIDRIMLPDTLGRMCPEQTAAWIGELVACHPGAQFDFHPHNDYGLATANALAAVRAGVHGIHVTVNGLGERAGNAALDEIVVVTRDLAGMSTRVQEGELVAAAKTVEAFTGRRLAPNKPISGAAVFTQTAGIHADGDRKGDLYVTQLRPERFCRTRTYALGKHAGKASLEMNLARLGLSLTPEQQRLVLQRIVELGDQKRMVTVDDLPYFVADVLESGSSQRVQIQDYQVTSRHDLPPTATITVRVDGQEYQATATGAGGYDAFMTALRDVLGRLDLVPPTLLDFEVHIPPGGHTDALVETTITWQGGLATRGVGPDQIQAAIRATERMLNRWLSPIEALV
jgi:D-citramalate synthase